MLWSTGWVWHLFMESVTGLSNVNCKSIHMRTLVSTSTKWNPAVVVIIIISIYNSTHRSNLGVNSNVAVITRGEPSEITNSRVQLIPKIACARMCCYKLTVCLRAERKFLTNEHTITLFYT